jgi:hypothetical protein
VVVGCSIGASVAFEMVVTGSFSGPVVLIGISLSAKDESAFFRGIVQASKVLGNTPSRVLATVAASMIKRTALSTERKRELQEDFRRNIPRDITRALREYVSWWRRQLVTRGEFALPDGEEAGVVVAGGFEAVEGRERACGKGLRAVDLPIPAFEGVRTPRPGVRKHQEQARGVLSVHSPRCRA